MSLDAKEQGALEAIFRGLDRRAALNMANGFALDPATVLAMFGLFRDVVRPLEPRFADRLIAHASEDVASRISAQAIAAQIETQCAATAPEPKGQP